MAVATAKLKTGEEVPVLTRRLQGVPIDGWTVEDFDEECTAWDEKCERNKREVAGNEWLIRICKPLFAVHPNATMGEVIRMLPEPQRSKATEILNTPVLWEDLPIEFTNREPWHERVERSVVAKLSSNPHRFTTADVLKEALISKSSPEWSAAMEYADSLLEASNGRRIENAYGQASKPLSVV
jgi:hypothetical protein